MNLLSGPEHGTSKLFANGLSPLPVWKAEFCVVQEDENKSRIVLRHFDDDSVIDLNSSHLPSQGHRAQLTSSRSAFKDWFGLFQVDGNRRITRIDAMHSNNSCRRLTQSRKQSGLFTFVLIIHRIGFSKNFPPTPFKFRPRFARLGCTDCVLLKAQAVASDLI